MTSAELIDRRPRRARQAYKGKVVVGYDLDVF
jgi:hypothetical protein